MRKLFLTSAAVAFFASAPAMAAVTTVEYVRDSSETFVVTLDGEGGASMADGTTMTYIFDAEANKMCFTAPDDTVTCVIYAESVPEPKVGDSVRYKIEGTDIEGTATITARTE